MGGPNRAFVKSFELKDKRCEMRMSDWPPEASEKE